MYTFAEVKKTILNCLESIGVTIDDASEDVNFQMLGMDSIMFIMFIVEVETAFDIAMPSDFLFFDDFVSLNGFAEKVLLILEQNQQL